MIRKFIPWWARIAVKLVLSRLPVGYGLWRRLNLFSHGAMHRVDYALNVFQQHFARRPVGSDSNLVLLEIGPGDSLLSAVIGAAYGAQYTYLIDVGAFATADVTLYRDAIRTLRTHGLTPPTLDGVVNTEDLLRACRASYSTQGLASLREIPTGSVDFVWSHAVLEHIRRHEFLDFMRETRRVLREGGICSHQIDLQDHLGGALNNMRIPSRWWEAEWMARSGFYTNRMRQSDMLRAFEAAGFVAKLVTSTRWETTPTPRRALAREFQGFGAEELRVKEFAVVLNPA
jgi:SAM-dependent methyltransferase